MCRQLPAHTRPVDKQASGPSKTAPQAKPQTTVVTAAPPGSRDAATGMVASDLKVAICGMTRNQVRVGSVQFSCGPCLLFAPRVLLIACYACGKNAF